MHKGPFAERLVVVDQRLEFDGKYRDRARTNRDALDRILDDLLARGEIEAHDVVDLGIAQGVERVGIIGTGATAVQCIPPLARDSKELNVFQRTPSSIDVRNNHPIDPEWFAVAPALTAEKQDIDELVELIERSLLDALEMVGH